MDDQETMYRLSQTLRELAFLSSRAAQALEDGRFVTPDTPEVRTMVGTPVLPVVPLPVPPNPKALPGSTKTQGYPKLVDKTVIDWETLRLTAVSKLAMLLRDKVYIPRVASDKGYMWLGEQMGVPGGLRDFLVNQGATLNAVNFIRLCQWLDYDPSEFVEYGDGS